MKYIIIFVSLSMFGCGTMMEDRSILYFPTFESCNDVVIITNESNIAFSNQACPDKRHGPAISIESDGSDYICLCDL